MTQVTVVATPAQLQAASIAGAQYIEVQAHLDLRHLGRLRHNDLPRDSPLRDLKTPQALFYIHQNMTSLRGNCSDPDAMTALGLASTTEASRLAAAGGLLPLKPRQCLLLLPDTFAFTNGGRFWLDNLYLRLDRRRHGSPEAAFMLSGLREFEIHMKSLRATHLVATNVTMHGDGRAPVNGIRLKGSDLSNTASSTALVQDCIFTSWRGYLSPLGIFKSSRANVVDTIFLNMRLPVGIVDVSWNGLVRFRNASLANVSLPHEDGRVVGTTMSDYRMTESGSFSRVQYYEDDDDGMDVEVSQVPPDARGMFGEQFVIQDAVFSNCVYLNGDLGVVSPGCPAESLLRRHKMIAQKYGTARADKALNLSGETEPEAASVPADMPSLLSPWLVSLRRTLGPLPPPPPSWPLYDVKLQGESGVVDSLTALQPVPPGRIVPFGPGPEVLSPSHGNAGGLGAVRRIALAATLAVLAAVALAAALWAAWSVRRIGQRRKAPPPEPAPILLGGNVYKRWMHMHMHGQPVWRMNSGLKSTTEGNCTSTSVEVPGASHSPHRRLACAAAYSVVHNSVPDSAMNPEYEYALPTEVAGFMMGPAPESGALTQSGPQQDRARRELGKTELKPRSDSERHSRNCEIRAGEASFAAMQCCLASNGVSCGIPMSPYSSATMLASSAPVTGAAARAHRPHMSSLQVRSVKSCSELNVAGPVGARTRRVSVGRMLSNLATRRASRDSPFNSVLEQGSTNGPRLRAASALEVDTEAHSVGVGRVLHTDPSTGWTDWTESAEEAAVASASVRNTISGSRLIDRLQRQLDVFTEEDLFLGRFVMLGREQRRRGGQAVVQYAEDVADHRDFAVKFFLDWAAFVTEAALYATAFPRIRARVSSEVAARARDSGAAGIANRPDGGEVVAMGQVIAKFLPRVEAVCDGAEVGLKDPQGRPLPPCIVMEKGESLHDWSDRAEPDFFTCLAVLSHVSQRLADMHDAGYVHRDLKPANVMWLPRQNRWTVIDFGCVARAGQQAPLQFTVAYAAPEVIRAFLLQQYVVEATPALDAWSLGVMAFELLTGAPAFDIVADGRARVMQRVRGDLALPWEGKLSALLKRKLGAFKGPVLKLLQRDPGHRSSMRAFHASCNRLFAAQTTIEA